MRSTITDKGRELLAKLQLGEICMEFSSAKTGSGTYTSDESISERTALKIEKNSYTFSSAEEQDDGILLSSIFSNVDPVSGETVVLDDYRINEIGLYVTVDGGSDEFLYIIAVVDGHTGNIMPGYDGTNPIQFIETFKAHMNTDLNVTVNYESAAALASDLNGKGDNLVYDAETDTLSLMSGDDVLSSVNIESGNPIKVGDVSGATANTSATNITLKWSDPVDTTSSEGVVLAKWKGTKVVRKTGSAPTSLTDGTLVVNNITRNQYSSSGFTDNSLEYNTTYYYRFFPYTEDGVYTEGSSVSAAPEIVEISAVPVQSGSLTFNNTTQTATFSGFNSSQLDVTGNTGKNAGSYTATFTPKEGYIWWDGTLTAKTVSWSIGKATGVVSVSDSTVTLNTSNLYKDVTITSNSGATLTVTSGDTSIATVAHQSGDTYRITAVANGTATITASIPDTANYTAGSAQITANVSLVDNVLDNNDWDTISAVSAAGTGSNYWSVGDCKKITLNGTVGTKTYSNVDTYVFIIGFNHNSATEGTGITFQGFKTAKTGGTNICLDDDTYNTNAGSSGQKKFQMNHWGNSSSSPYNTNYGGWAACDMRYDILGSTNQAPTPYGSTKTTSATGKNPTSTCATNPVSNTLMAALPSALRAVMKAITKYTDNKGNSSNTAANVTATQDYLPLLSEYEVQGARTYANDYEKNSQVQYDYYKNGNSKVKYRQTTTSVAARWWCRSADYDNASRFCRVDTDGCAANTYSRTSNGLAPAFLV